MEKNTDIRMIKLILSNYAESLKQLIDEGDKKAFSKCLEYVGERLWNLDTENKLFQNVRNT